MPKELQNDLVPLIAGNSSEFRANGYQFLNHTQRDEYIDFGDPLIQQRLTLLSSSLRKIEEKTGQQFTSLISVDSRYGYAISLGLDKGDPANLMLGTLGWAEGRPELTEGILLHEAGHAVSENTRFVQKIAVNSGEPLFLDVLGHFIETEPQRAAGWMKETYGSVERGKAYIESIRPNAEQVIQAVQPIVGKTDVELFGMLQNDPALLQKITNDIPTIRFEDYLLNSPVMQIMSIHEQDAELRGKVLAAAEMGSYDSMVREHHDAHPLKDYSATLHDLTVLETLKPLLQPYRGATISFGSIGPAAQRAEEYLADQFALRHAAHPEHYLASLHELAEAERHYRNNNEAMATVFGVDQSTHPKIEDRISVSRKFLNKISEIKADGTSVPPESVVGAVGKEVPTEPTNYVERLGSAAKKALANEHIKGGVLGAAGAVTAAGAELAVGNGPQAALNAAQEAILPGSTTAGTDVCKQVGVVSGGVAGAVAGTVVGAAAGAATSATVAGVPMAPFAAVAAGAVTYSVTQPVVNNAVHAACDAVVPGSVKQAVSYAEVKGDEAIDQLVTSTGNFAQAVYNKVQAWNK